MTMSLPDVIARKIIEDYLEGGALSVGDRLPSVRELTRRYGSSNTTISHALSILAAQGYVQKSQGKGSFFTAPQAETAPRTGLVGLVLVNSTAEVMMRIHQGVQRICLENGCNLVVATSDWSYEQERDGVARMQAAGCRAVIVAPIPRQPKMLRSDYLNHEFLDLPIVLVDLGMPSHRRSQVVFDNVRAGKEMTEWLLQLGHRRIAFVEAVTRAGLAFRSHDDRMKGYLAALKAAGITPEPRDRWLVDQDNWDPDVRMTPLIEKWRSEPDHATAVIAFDDCQAAEIIATARDLGVEVPGELAVAGFDNIRVARTIRPPFPTTDPDFVRAGEVAAEMALQEAAGESKPPMVYMLPAPLEPRC